MKEMKKLNTFSLQANIALTRHLTSILIYSKYKKTMCLSPLVTPQQRLCTEQASKM